MKFILRLPFSHRNTFSPAPGPKSVYPSSATLYVAANGHTPPLSMLLTQFSTEMVYSDSLRVIARGDRGRICLIGNSQSLCLSAPKNIGGYALACGSLARARGDDFERD